MKINETKEYNKIINNLDIINNIVNSNSNTVINIEEKLKIKSSLDKLFSNIKIVGNTLLH